MTQAPSFSSFPDLAGKEGGAERKDSSQYIEKQSNATAGPSRHTAPTFSSFPDLPSGSSRPEAVKAKHRGRSRQDEVYLTERDRRDLERDRRTDDDRKRRRSRSRDRDDERHKDRHRTDKRHEDEDAKERKEARRKREREKAERLIRGEVVGTKEEKPKVEKEERREVWDASDGRAWYESVIKPNRGGYEPTYDPASGSAWFKDSVGDKDAAKYGAAASYAPPRYRRDGGGSCLITER